MSYRVVYTKAFNGYRRDIRTAGYKKVTHAINPALLEARPHSEALNDVAHSLRAEAPSIFRASERGVS